MEPRDRVASFWSAGAERSGDPALDVRQTKVRRTSESKAPSPLRSAGALQSYRSRFVLVFFFLLFPLLGLFLLLVLMFDAHDLSGYRAHLYLVDCAFRVADIE